jgi:hypothetical protein
MWVMKIGRPGGMTKSIHQGQWFVKRWDCPVLVHVAKKSNQAGGSKRVLRNSQSGCYSSMLYSQSGQGDRSGELSKIEAEMAHKFGVTAKCHPDQRLANRRGEQRWARKP